MRKIITVLSAVVVSTGFGLTALAGSASASTGPRSYTQGSSGYSVTHAQFRYVQDTVYLRSPSTFAAVDDGVSWETHLFGINTSDGDQVSADINIGGDPQNDSPYHPWADVNGQALTLQGDTAFSAGQSVTETIYYNKASGVVSVSVFDANGDSAFGQAHVGSSVSFSNPRIYGGFDTGSSLAAPASQVTLARFTGVKLTTYSGHRGTIAGWYSHNKVLATSDGTSAGTVQAKPSDLGNGGNSFSVFFTPAS
jgi:hypothetical protein